MSRVITSFATGYLRTTVTRDDDGTYLWTRRPGADRNGQIRVPHPLLHAAVASAPTGRVALTLPEPAEGGVTYRVRRFPPVATLFLGLAGEVPELMRVAGDTLAATALTLAALHAVPVPDVEVAAVPVGVRRLLNWLRGGRGPRGAAELHRRAHVVLGRDRLDLVESWCAIVGGRRVLLHGAPGHGILLPVGDDPADAGALLIGEDLAAGPPEFDLGWLIGELVEFGHAGVKPGPLGRADYDALVHRLLDAYPAPLDRAAVGRVALLRFLTHTHDFSAYMGWHDTLDDYLSVLAGVIDAATDGRLLLETSHR
ncbi:hypothetical protein [Herbidospora mongoliensis]|uniref:hypothetical protein n=1 Tax=Herbidospora mongoliensis TaxID=688067 RepID=UPI0008332B23|nr:hypothetical protein [Herbidospora mongoliensis]